MSRQGPPSKLIEVRTYTLKPGTGAAFAECVRTRVLPLLERSGTDVVAYGLSRHDPNTAYLIRGYASLAERERDQDAFYGSAAWRDGPRAAILDLIVHYADVVLEVDEQTLRRFRTTS